MRPSPEFDPTAYLEKAGLIGADVNPLLHYIQRGSPSDPDAFHEKRAAPEAAPSVNELLDERRAPWAPLPVYFDEKGEPSVSVVLDSVVRSFAFDRSATAMSVGCLIARRLGAKLRIVTLGVSFDPSVFGQILNAHAISYHVGVDFVHVPASGGRSLAVTASDKIVTSSWASTRAALGAVSAEQILYLVQQNERNECLCSDERLLCDETLSHPKVQVLVETNALLDELVAGDRSGHLATRACAFEPAPSDLPSPWHLVERKLRNFILYADPYDQRNLYRRSLEALRVAMFEETLSPQQWAFHFIGRQLEEVVLPGGVRPAYYESSDWTTYAALIASMDLGLCLTDGPRPSQLVLDLEAAGAVIVTSKIPRFSRNILPTSLDVGGICETLRHGVALAGDLKTRSLHRSEAGEVRRAWDAELVAALDSLRIGMR